MTMSFEPSGAASDLDLSRSCDAAGCFPPARGTSGVRMADDADEADGCDDVDGPRLVAAWSASTASAGACGSPAETPLPVRIVADIQVAAHLLRGALTAYYAEFGLNDIRHGVLTMLRDGGATGCTQAELARELNQSESSISTLVRRMRADGLIYRLRPKDDQRKRQLLLTERGAEMLAGVERCHSDRMAELLGSFGSDQLGQMAQCLDVLIGQLTDLRKSRVAARKSPQTGSAASLRPSAIPAAESQQQPAA